MSSVWTIRRSTSEAKVAGVCGGVARHWGVDPVLVRVGCALLALSGGIGLVLYLAGWLLLPKEGSHDPLIFDVVGPQARRWTREVWLVLVGVCCLVTFALLAPLTPFGIGPAAILALVWYFGYYKHSGARGAWRGSANKAPLGPGQRRPAPPVPGLSGTPTPASAELLGPEPQDTPFDQAAQAWRQRITQIQVDAAQPAPVGVHLPWPDTSASHAADEGYEPAGPASLLSPVTPEGAAAATFSGQGPEPVPASVWPSRSMPIPSRAGRVASRSARRLRLVSFSVLALTLIGLGAADARGVAVPLEGYFATALLVLGLTLVAAAWLGRAKGILPLALLVLLATVATTAVGPVARSLGWEREQQTYTSVTDLGPGDRRALGRLQVDLRQLRLTGDATYTAHVGVGAVEVSAPPDTTVVVNWKVRAGAVIVEDTPVSSGSDLHGTQRLDTRRPDGTTLVLNLSVDQGVVQVRR